MSIQPQGEDLRRATKWISDQRRDTPELPIAQLVDQASLKFDLSPLDAGFLLRTLKQADQETSGKD